MGAIHWAGTETSEIWSRYMDGVVRAGIRAAAEVMAQRVRPSGSRMGAPLSSSRSRI